MVWNDVLPTDLQHHLLKLTWSDQLTTTSIAKGEGVHRVLDVGTGTGIWAIEYGQQSAPVETCHRAKRLTGDKHPEAIVIPNKKASSCVAVTYFAQILGVDVSPVQPSLWVPSSDIYA